MLDTGIADHPDIASRLTADGFDFVSSLGRSGDGDGIDGDPTDLEMAAITPNGTQ